MPTSVTSSPIVPTAIGASLNSSRLEAGVDVKAGLVEQAEARLAPDEDDRTVSVVRTALVALQASAPSRFMMMIAS